MSLNDKLFILFAGIAALLGAASLIGFVLARRATSETGRATSTISMPVSGHGG